MNPGNRPTPGRTDASRQLSRIEIRVRVAKNITPPEARRLVQRGANTSLLQLCLLWSKFSMPVKDAFLPLSIYTVMWPYKFDFRAAHFQDQTAISKLIESYGTVGLIFPRGVFVFISSTTPNCSRIARSAETFFTSLMTTFANA